LHWWPAELKKRKRKKEKKELVWNCLIPWGGTVLCVLPLFPPFLVLVVGMCGNLRGISYFSISVCRVYCLVIRFVGIYGPGFHLFYFMSWELGEVKRLVRSSSFLKFMLVIWESIVMPRKASPYGPLPEYRAVTANRPSALWSGLLHVIVMSPFRVISMLSNRSNISMRSCGATVS